jgi:SMODS-associated and fused to various effectors sensor domain
VLFGRHLSDKVATRYFHRHRSTDNWQWLATTKSMQLGTRALQQRSDGARVGIVVSMSGPIERGSLPRDIDQTATLYEIFVDGLDPNLRLVKSDEDVRHFREVYAALLSRIAVAHSDCRELHLFLATPPPVAIMCGLERLPKVQPMLVLYDNVATPDNSRTFIKRLTTR